MLEIDALQPQVRDLCRQLGVQRLDLFGSATRQNFGPESDVDLLVRFEPEGGDLFNRYFDLKEKMEEMLGRRVDLVVERAIRNPYFKETVEQSRYTLYAGQVPMLPEK